MDTELVAKTHADETLYVDRANPERGAQGSFYPVYRTESRERRWGYYCDNCESLDVAVDTMGRVECNDCGNIRKPDEWDAAHE